MSYLGGAMTTPEERVEVPREAGDCATCAHARAVRNARGSLFVLCQRAREDPTFTRYPPLPVNGCRGHLPTAA